ncbi:MAG TPA: SDR family oxidoreductase [Solirubrobacter sp.]|jgi:3-oxoacyl-[acyl-carrier protein] reductase|nr:SDR family oxidoreductase [Solirubrobacter sp.]
MHVLVTGGSGAIGGAIAAAFSAAGADVMVTSRSGRVGIAMDLEAPETIDAAVAEASADGLDTLVVNAVRWPNGFAERFEELDGNEWRAVLRANVEGAFALVQAALPALRESNAGRIVLISSGAAEEGHPPAPHYVAAKAALHGLCRALAWDAGRDGVLVNAIATGFTRTPAGIERLGNDIYDRAGALTPQRRASTPEDVAALALWLGSEANTSVTGEVIREGTSAARTPLVALA